jgi:hypothetical protein
VLEGLDNSRMSSDPPELAAEQAKAAAALLRARTEGKRK